MTEKGTAIIKTKESQNTRGCGLPILQQKNKNDAWIEQKTVLNSTNDLNTVKWSCTSSKSNK
jgi:hypothetical protein